MIGETEQQRMLREQEESLAPEWYNVGDYWRYHADKLMERYREFTQLFEWVKNNPVDPEKYPELARDRAKLLSDGEGVKSRVGGTIDTIRKAWTWVRGTTGVEGVQVAQYLGGLGAIPLIPVAVVTGAVALIAKWINDAYMFSRRLAEIKRLEAQGVPSAEAARIVAQTMPKGFFEGGGSYLIPVAIVGAVLLVKFLDRG